MAVLFKNTCQYSGCCKTFYTLSDLIIHIESDHLDFDPSTIEQLEEEKPASLPLSYVLRFSGPNETPPQYLYNTEENLNEAVIEELEDEGLPEVTTAINNNYLPIGFKEKKVRSEGKLTGVSHVLGSNKLFTLDHSQKKPFACNMKGCEKRYKNVNGIKYHYKNHHKMLIPTLKKSLLKHKPILNTPKPKTDRQDVHGIPLISFKSMPNDTIYHSFDDCEALANEYFYKYNSLPTSDVHLSSTQVPLSNNMSFNYYNLGEGDIEDYSGKNSNFFVTSFDKI